MPSNIVPHIAGQVPEHLVGDAPIFVAFLEAYYAYDTARRGSTGSVQNLLEERDIDRTDSDLIDKFYMEYAPYLPKTTVFDRRSLIKLMGEIYEAKGTAKGFKLLFRALYGEEISISEPAEQILRSSAGNWSQRSFFTIVTAHGSASQLLDTELRVTNTEGIFYLKPDQIEQIEVNTHRVYYRGVTKVILDVGQVLELNEGDTITYRGTVIETPNLIRITDGGAAFRVGRIFEFPGTTKPTLFKIIGVDAAGAITSVEIVSTGYTHTEAQSIQISPYRSAPQSTGNSITRVETAPGVWTTDIGIDDVMYGLQDTVNGVSIGLHPGSYFLEDYVQDSYEGQVLFVKSYGEVGPTTQPSLEESEDITLQEYLDSRATLILTGGPIAKTRGRYIDNAGQLSDQSIRLQDNRYYQLFSYVISSNLDVSKYRESALKMLHPAGLRWFAAIEKSADLGVRDRISVDSQYTFRVDVVDVVNADESVGVVK